MEKKNVAAFFDRCAAWWDADMIRNEPIIAKILDNAGVRAGVDVLDVACGTGVLFPDYLGRNVASVTGIDISSEMAKLAAAKFPQATVVCGDVEAYAFEKQFDVVMVYNAFPHFPDPAQLVRTLAGLVKPGGRLSIAHGMSRAQLQQHHAGRAAAVSIDLIHERELAALMAPYFDVDVVISDERMYQVCGVRLEGEDFSRTPAKVQETPLEELVALMRFTVSHNDAHAREMVELASMLRDAGRTGAYQRVMDAVADFDVLNAKLEAVLSDLTESELK
jgi:demethylmenaquinone methyltransferase/2-methoxy-6-polyprenyl-1,4-benzoquinol methylase